MALLLSLNAAVSAADEEINPPPFTVFGPAYSNFELTLRAGERTEIAGPVLSMEENGEQSLFAISPLFSLYRDPAIPQTEFELLYPILTLDRFGEEYRLQLMQLLSWGGGESMQGSEVRRFTLFPIYFQQRSPIPERNYTAVVPFYGTLKNRLFRDEISFLMLPLYLQTVKRDVVTDNYLFPLFHRRHGPGLNGWQFWPVVGKEHKDVTTATNIWGDVSVVGGHDKLFVLWPFYFNNTLGIGTTNVQEQFVLLPFYTSQVASNRVSKSYGFPIGYTHTIDRERQYEEWDAPWPLVVFARGPGKTANRVWPIFGQARTPTLQSDFYAWPVYKYNAIYTESLKRERTRILLFLYSDTKEHNLETGTMIHRTDFWPFYTWRKDHQDNSRLQVLSLLEPILPNNKSIERLYSPVYSIWRQEHNAETGEKSKSLLWNLYRSEQRKDSKKHSIFFGMFQREKSGETTKWRVFYIPFTAADRAHAVE